MATAADFPTAFAKAERAAGRPLPTEGTVFLSVRDADKPAAVPVAAALPDSASSCSPRAAPPRRSPPPGSRSSGSARCRSRARRRRSSTASAAASAISSSTLRRAPGHAATVTSSARPRWSPASPASRRSRARKPPSTRLRTRAARTHCRSRNGMRKRERLSVAGLEAIGPYTLLRLERGGLEPGIPGQFFMLQPPERVLPRPMSLCCAPRGELGFLIDPIGPGTRALCVASRRASEIAVPARSATATARCRPAASGRRWARRSLRSRTCPRRWAARRRCSGFGARGTPRRRRSSRTPRSCSSRRYVTEALPVGGARHPRLRARADARGRPRARAGRPARLGSAHGLRLRRLLRLRRGDRRRAEAPVRRRPVLGGRVRAAA